MRDARRGREILLLLAFAFAFAFALMTGHVARATDAPDDPAKPLAGDATTEPSDAILRRVLSSGCREGLPDVQALAANGTTPWAESVARMCGDVLRARPMPRLALTSPSIAHHKRDGRGAMVIASTIYGLWVGIATDVLFTIDGPRSAIIAPLLGMGAGLGLSLVVTGDHPLDNGQAWTIITGLEFGSVNGALWAGGLDLSATNVVGTALAMGLSSGAIALLAAKTLDPRQGDVEVIRSGLIWGTVTGLLGMAAISTNGTSETYLRGAGVAMDLGFLAGLGIASSFDVPRNRDLLIDAGTLGGGVAGLGLAWLLTAGPDVSTRPIFVGGLVGMYAGMAAAIFFTRHMENEDGDDAPTVAAVWGRDARGRWGFGAPGPTPVLDGLGHRIIGVTFDAVGGVF